MRSLQELEYICLKNDCTYNAKEIVESIRDKLSEINMSDFHNKFIGSVHEHADIKPYEKVITKGMSKASKALVSKYEKSVNEKVDSYTDPIFICFPTTRLEPLMFACDNFERMMESIYDILEQKELNIIKGKDPVVISYWSHMVPYLVS